MVHIWDYDKKVLEKTKSGRKLILERQINFGPGKEKISLAEAKKNWHKLNINPNGRRLLKMLIWNKKGV